MTGVQTCALPICFPVTIPALILSIVPFNWPIFWELVITLMTRGNLDWDFEPIFLTRATSFRLPVFWQKFPTVEEIPRDAMSLEACKI